MKRKYCPECGEELLINDVVELTGFNERTGRIKRKRYSFILICPTPYCVEKNCSGCTHYTRNILDISETEFKRFEKAFKRKAYKTRETTLRPTMKQRLKRIFQ